MADKFEIKKSHAVAVVAGAAIIWWLLFRKKLSQPVAQAASDDAQTNVTVTYQYPDLPDGFFSDFGGIPSLGNEYFPLFGFVGFRAF
jgi:hypothetical protein